MASGDDVYPDVGKIGTIIFAQDSDGNVIPVTVDGSGNLKISGIINATIDESTLAKESGGNLANIATYLGVPVGTATVNAQLATIIANGIKTTEQSPISGFATATQQTNGSAKTQITSQVSSFQTLQNAVSVIGVGSSIAVGNYGSMVVTINPATTITALTVVFQAQDSNGLWFNVSSIRNTDNTMASSTTTAITTNPESWTIPCAGFSNVRANITAYTGSGNVTINGVLVA
jgi:hypothetical protein